MLAALKQYWLALVAGAIALAYFLGIKRGKNDEKAHQNQKVLENMALADKARASLDNPTTARKLREKYTRK